MRGQYHSLAGILGVCLGVMSFADELQAKDLCYENMNTAPAVAIEHCDAMIASGRYTRSLGTIYNNRGNAYYALKQYALALADYDRAIRVHPTDPDPRYNPEYGRGLAHFALDQFELAARDLTAALRGQEPSKAVIYLKRGIAYENLHDDDRALADYDKAFRLNPTSAEAVASRGFILYRKGEVDRAIADYTEAIRLDSDDGHSYNNRAVAYHAKKEYDRAIADYDQAIRLSPDIRATAVSNREIAIKARQALREQNAAAANVSSPSVAPATQLASLPEQTKPGAFCPDSTAARNGFVLVDNDGGRFRIEPSTTDVVTTSHLTKSGTPIETSTAYKGFFFLGSTYDFDYKTIPFFEVGYHKIFRKKRNQDEWQVDLRVEGTHKIEIGGCSYDTYVVREQFLRADGTPYYVDTDYYSPTLRTVLKTDRVLDMPSSAPMRIEISYVRLERLN